MQVPPFWQGLDRQSSMSAENAGSCGYTETPRHRPPSPPSPLPPAMPAVTEHGGIEQDLRASAPFPSPLPSVVAGPCRAGMRDRILPRYGEMLRPLTDLTVLPGEARGAAAAADGAVGTAGPAVQAGVVLAGVGRSCGVGAGALSRGGEGHRGTHPLPHRHPRSGPAPALPAAAR